MFYSNAFPGGKCASVENFSFPVALLLLVYLCQSLEAAGSKRMSWAQHSFPLRHELLLNFLRLNGMALNKRHGRQILQAFKSFRMVWSKCVLQDPDRTL